MNKKNIISLISFIISLILIFVFVFPLFSSARAIYSDLTQKRQEIEKLKELSSKIGKIEQDYDSISEAIEKVLLALPEEKDLPQLLVQFEKIAVNNGLLLESIEFGEISKKEESDFIRSIEDYETLNQSKKMLSTFPNSSVLLKVVGSYSAFKNYISALEKNVRSMDIYSIQFSFSESGMRSLFSDSGIFEFNLGINVYYK